MWELAEESNIEPFVVYENTGAVFGNMEYTGEYNEEGFNLVLEDIAKRIKVGMNSLDQENKDIRAELSDYHSFVVGKIESLHESRRLLDDGAIHSNRLLPFAASEHGSPDFTYLKAAEGVAPAELVGMNERLQALDDQIQQSASDCQDEYDSFDLMVEVAEESETITRLMILTTMGGIPVTTNTTLSIRSVNHKKEEFLVPFGIVPSENGLAVASFKTSLIDESHLLLVTARDPGSDVETTKLLTLS